MKTELHPISSLLQLLAICMAAALFTCACSRPPRHQSTFDRARAVMDSLPEQALLILDSIPTDELEPGLDSARYILLHALAEDKTYTLSTPDSALHAAISTLRRLDQTDDLRQALYLLGCRLFRQERYNEGITNLLEAENHIDNATPQLERGLIYHELAECCNALLLGTEAISYAQMANDAYLSANRPLHAAYALHDKAVFQNNHLDYDEAIKTFLLTKRSADNLEDYHLSDNCTAGIAYSFIGKHLYANAVRYFRCIPDTSPAFDDQTKALRAFAEAHAGDKILADSISKQLMSEGNYRGIYGLDTENASVQIVMDAYEKQEAARDSVLADAYRNNFTTILKSSFATERELLETKIKTKRQLNISLIIFSIIIAAIAGTAIYIYRRKTKAEKEINLWLTHDLLHFMQTEPHTIQINRKVSESTEIPTHAHSLSLLEQKAKALNAIVMSYYGKANSDEVSPELVKSQLGAMIRQTCDDLRENTEIQKEIEDIVNSRENQIIQRFKDEIPGLKPKEILLYTLLVGEFNTLTLTKIFNIKSLETFAVTKSRLKKKIITQNPPSIDDFLFFFK